MATKKIVPVEQARKEGKPMAANNQEKTTNPVEEKKFTSVTVRDEYGNTYKLQFNSRVVKAMERKGFQLNLDYPNTMIEDLWTGAFQMHHSKITSERIKAIWAVQRNKQDLLGILTALYAQPLQELMNEPEGDGADPTWETD